MTKAKLLLGRAGHQERYNQIDTLSYTLVIKYKKEPLTQDYCKKGELISGFLHHTPYNSRDKTALLHPCKDMKPWGDSSSLEIYQNAMQAGVVVIPEYEPLELLPLSQPMSEAEAEADDFLSSNPTQTITRRRMIVLTKSSAYGEQMLKDFQEKSQNIIKRYDQFLNNYFKEI